MTLNSIIVVWVLQIAWYIRHHQAKEREHSASKRLFISTVQSSVSDIIGCCELSVEFSVSHFCGSKSASGLVNNRFSPQHFHGRPSRRLLIRPTTSIHLFCNAMTGDDLVDRPVACCYCQLFAGYFIPPIRNITWTANRCVRWTRWSQSHL